MLIPDDLRYSHNHEWARREGQHVRIGITDFAQDAMGDVVYVDFLVVDARVGKDARVGEIESTKSVSEIYAPISGVIVEVNPMLSNNYEFINRDPYGEGWLMVIAPDDAQEFESLLSPIQYGEFLRE